MPSLPELRCPTSDDTPNAGLPCPWPPPLNYTTLRLAGRQLIAIDGTCLDMPDTPVDDEYFARPGTAKGERAAFSQAPVAALVECGTHAIFKAAISPYTTLDEDLSAVTTSSPGSH